MRAFVLSLLLTPLFVACASGGTGGASSTSGSTNLISAEALAEIAIQERTALNAVRRLRPNWLRSRNAPGAGGFGQGGVEPSLHVDGLPRERLLELGEIQISEVHEIRFMSASDATTRFGTGYPNGLIQVTTKQGRTGG